MERDEERLMVCGECGQEFDPADLDQVLFHVRHVPLVATGIVGVPVESFCTCTPVETVGGLPHKDCVEHGPDDYCRWCLHHHNHPGACGHLYGDNDVCLCAYTPAQADDAIRALLREHRRAKLTPLKARWTPPQPGVVIDFDWPRRAREEGKGSE